MYDDDEFRRELEDTVDGVLIAIVVTFGLLGVALFAAALLFALKAR